uniref:Arylsulfatase n=1 Tax=Roseihalotalea indica TaxID=2867963 RepID=A0AA49GSJ2_9BACT|nr:arylsulfatase [Tunicatimonas sp. TK19036]
MLFRPIAFALLVGSSLLLSCNSFQPTDDTASQENKRPNILLIMADDMGYSDIGCYGGEIRTPNLNRLAENGLRFSQFYNTARCCPTRASLMTGLYPHQAGVGHMMNDRGTDGYRGDLNEHSVTIAEVLKQAGYRTFMSGKWHVTKHVGLWSGDSTLTSTHNWPMQRGFDQYYGTITGAGSFYNPITLVEGNTPVNLQDTSYYYTDAISEKAINYIQDTSGAPFFGYIAYTSPHWPLHALPEDIARYDGRYDIGWDSLRQERLQRMRDMGLIKDEWPLTERDERVSAWETAEEKDWQARRMEVYAAQIDRMDQGIGKILEALEEEGKLDNTLIFFLADNGGCAEELAETWGNPLFLPDSTMDGGEVIFGNEHTNVMPGPRNVYQSYGVPWANASNTPFRLYKHYVHEGGISTPLIAHWPNGISASGQWRQTPGHLIDIMATCVAVGQAEYPEEARGNTITPMEGVSLLPAFAEDTLNREAIYFEHEGNRAIRRGEWKLVAKSQEGAWELYNMERDRSETNNVAAEHPDLVKELSTLWQQWADRANVLPWPS